MGCILSLKTSTDLMVISCYKTLLLIIVRIIVVAITNILNIIYVAVSVIKIETERIIYRLFSNIKI